MTTRTGASIWTGCCVGVALVLLALASASPWLLVLYGFFGVVLLVAVHRGAKTALIVALAPVGIGLFILLAILMAGSGNRSTTSAPRGQRKFPMSGDRIVGNGGNATVYQRPDGSQYALDRSGRGGEGETRIIGPAEFDSRPEAIQRRNTWQGSRSLHQ